MRLEFFGVAVLLYTLENEHLEPQKRSWRFGRKMKTAGFQRDDFMFQKPFFLPGCMGLKCTNFSVQFQSLTLDFFGLG